MNAVLAKSTARRCICFLGPTLAAAVFLAARAQADTTSGLALWWRLNEAQGTMLRDSGPNTLHGVAAQASWTLAERVGLNFPDASAPTATHPSALHSANALTVSFWARFNAIDTDSRFGHVVSAQGAHPDGLNWRVYHSQNNLFFQVELLGTNGATGRVVIATPVPQLGTWHHLAFTYKSAANGVIPDESASIFLDGNRVVGNGAYRLLRIWDGTHSITLGGTGVPLPQGSTLLANVALRDFRVYARALSTADVSEVMSVGLGGYAAQFTNGSFELPTGLPAQPLAAGSNVLIGWTIGANGGPAYWSLNHGGLAPVDGARVLAFNWDGSGLGTWITQTLDTVVGREYQVMFAAGQTGVGSSLTALAKSSAGVVLRQFDATLESVFNTYRFRFFALSPATPLEFRATGGNVVLDNVVVTLIPRDFGDGRHGSYVLTENKTIEQLYQLVRLPTDPAAYDPLNANAVPNFRSLTISSNATLNASPWNGSTGGRVVCKVQGVLFVATGSRIDVSGQGYRAGVQEQQQGESYAGSAIISPNANFGGGGGGYIIGTDRYFGAGGGGYGSTGARGRRIVASGPDEITGGAGGQPYGNESLDPVFLGSGGGRGRSSVEVNNAGGPGSGPGGNGGGAITLHAGRLRVEGLISANGADGGLGAGGGAGGSGGSILLRVNSAALGASSVTATGGLGGALGGGDGGVGRIRLEYSASYSGATSPAASVYFASASDLDGDGISDAIEWGTDLNSPLDTDGDGIFDFLDSDSDNDGIPDAVEAKLDGGTPRNSDGDGMPDYRDTDSDNDGVLDAIERGPEGLNPRDTDADGIPDYIDTDSDNNGIPDSIELGPDGNRRQTDTDGDGIPDYWEIFYGLNPNNALDANSVPTGDRLTNLVKYRFNLNPSKIDTDGDGLDDYDEVLIYGTDAKSKSDTDGDGMPDKWETENGLNPLVNDTGNDADGDGLTNLEEFNAGTNPRLGDSNPTDGFSSDYEKVKGAKPITHFYDRLDRLMATRYDNGAWEAWRYDGNGNIRAHSLKSVSDADGDGLPDVWEFAHGLTFDPGIGAAGTNGLGGDADGDGWTNYQEFLSGTSPANASEHPPSGGVAGAAWFNPPRARVIFPPLGGGGLAQVNVRVWDAEANPALIFLQWFDPIVGLWNPATVLRVNDLPVTGAPLASAPGGVVHSLLWNAQGVFPAGFSGQVLLRVTAQDAAGITVSEAVPYSVTTPGTGSPVITVQPLGRLTPAGQSHTFTVTVAGTSPFSYLWSKDGISISGVTTSSLALTNVQAENTGSYKVAVTNPVSSVTSQAALLMIGQVRHEVVGSVYTPGGTVTVSNTITYSGPLSGLGLRVLVPTEQGWSYVSGGGSEAEVKPVIGTTELLEWAWTTVPPSPVSFSYTLRVPPGQSGEKVIRASADLRQSSAFLQALVTPDPLVLTNVVRHSADSDGDLSISLFELTRVIELYNTRNGTVRTGCYKSDVTGEDGFAADAPRAAGSVAVLTRYHSADTRGATAGSPRDGAIDLFELTRVIELYNTRAGTVRTGRYHVQPGTEDGFAAGP